jgi:hypothetical protein
LLPCQLAKHVQRRSEWLLDSRDLEIRKGRRDPGFILIRSRRDRGVRLRSKLALIHL